MNHPLRGILLAAALAAPSPAFSAPKPYPGSAYPPGVGASKAVAAAPVASPATPTPRTADFDALIARAVSRHPLLAAEESHAAIARAEMRGARAALYPRLSASVDADYVIDREFGASTPNVVESLRPNSQVNAGLTASQLIFDGGAAFARIKAARARTRERERTIEARINDLALRALSVYLDAAVQQGMAALGDEYVARHERLVRDMKERERLGAGAQADVLRAEARLAAARARAADFAESARAAEIRYIEFFGEAPGKLDFPDFRPTGVPTREAAVALAFQNDPSLLAMIARTDSFKAEVGAAKGRRLPEIRANVSSVSYNVFNGADDYDIRAGVNLNYDLFAGGAREAEIRRAKSAAERQSHEEDLLRREIERDAAIAFERQATAAARLEAFNAALAANRAARDLVAERFRAARGTLLDLIEAENDWFEAGVRQLSGRADRDMAAFAMMEFTGDLLRRFSPREEDRKAAR
ncbi:MAG: TolC family protein [Parvularculaceae bacterium]